MLIKVLVVDDSTMAREKLIYLLSSDPEIEVIDAVRNDMDALAAVEKHKPDLIIMDIHRPTANSFEISRIIMETFPTPIVIVTVEDQAVGLDPIEAGALAIVPRPFGPGRQEQPAMSRQLLETVRLMSEVKVVRRWPKKPSAKNGRPAPAGELPPVRPRATPIRVVAIGTSTGGPAALRTLLSGLPKDFAVPVLVVQHIAEGFMESFVRWLGEACNRPILLVKDKMLIQMGNIYLAPDGYQMSVENNGHLSLKAGISENGLCPSVSYLFRSLIRVYGPQVIGILLTGMGKDGAKELAELHELGALTIAQDKASSVIHGMPGEAIRLGGVSHILSLDEIASFIVRSVAESTSK